MREFASYIGERWCLTLEVADAICRHHQSNDSIHFLTDYIPNLATQTPYTTISEVYSFLDEQKHLHAQREKTRTILKKSNLLDQDAEEKIELSISSVELDDLALAHRTSIRTRGHQAIAKGLAPLAELVSTNFTGDIEAEFAKFVGTDASLQSVDDVRTGVKDILAELYGYDEHARVMMRELAEDEGLIEIHYKKKTKKYDTWRDKLVHFDALTDEDLLYLREGEIKGDIKVRIVLQIFQVTELLKQEFLEFPESTSVDFLLDAMHDAWERLLHPMVEESVKDHLYRAAEANVVHTMVDDLRGQIVTQVTQGKQVFLVVAGYNEEEIELVALDSNGQLLRATKESIRNYGRAFISGKIKQLIELYRPSKVAVLNNKFGENSRMIVEQTIESLISKPEIELISSTVKIAPLLKSTYFKESTASLDEHTAKTYAYALLASVPLSLVKELGCSCFQFHDKQHLVADERIESIIHELYTGALLSRGVEIGKRNDHLLQDLGVSEVLLNELREMKKAGTLRCKDDLGRVAGVDERLFNNIAGYVVFPESDDILDKSAVHPVEFHMIDALCNKYDLSAEDLVKKSKILDEYEDENEEMVLFVKERLAKQLVVAQRYVSLAQRPKRRLTLNDLVLGNIYDGRITNITKFGVFVDINAVSDGLVHISELADQYVESAEQVVQPGERVRVKVIEIDRKKKRVSLSLKQAGGNRQIRASQNQIEDLVSYFNN